MARTSKETPTGNIYVVVALARNGGHGPWPAIVLATRNPVRAVQAARDTEVSGYDVDWSDMGVWVVQPPMGEYVTRPGHARTVVYARGAKNDDGTIREYFWSAWLAERFSMTVSHDRKPSQPVHNGNSPR